MSNDTMQISLVICTYNREKYLPQALESVRQLNFPAIDFELVVIDNNSTDNTAAIVTRFAAENVNMNVRYCFEANKGLSFARNRGLAEAASPIISYIDDDVILASDYLMRMTDFFRQYTHAVGVGGRVIPKYESGAEPVWMNKYLNGFVGRVDFGNEIKKFEGNMKYPAGCNMTYTKDILNKAGGFNNDLTFRSDDKYIFLKVTAISNEVYYLPGAALQHYIDAHRLTPENFKRLFLKTGNEEKIRIRKEGGSSGVFKKGIEFIIKYCASVALYFLFILKWQEPKGRYTMRSQWYTLKGFFSKSVFVR